jgi:hypothetical protein
VHRFHSLLRTRPHRCRNPVSGVGETPFVLDGTNRGRIFSPHGGLSLGYFGAPSLLIRLFWPDRAARSAVIEPFWRRLDLSKKVLT